MKPKQKLVEEIVMRCFYLKIEELQKSIIFDDQFYSGKYKELLLDRLETTKDMRLFIEMSIKNAKMLD